MVTTNDSFQCVFSLSISIVITILHRVTSIFHPWDIKPEPIKIFHHFSQHDWFLVFRNISVRIFIFIFPSRFPWFEALTKFSFSRCKSYISNCNFHCEEERSWGKQQFITGRNANCLLSSQRVVEPTFRNVCTKQGYPLYNEHKRDASMSKLGDNRERGLRYATPTIYICIPFSLRGHTESLERWGCDDALLLGKTGRLPDRGGKSNANSILHIYLHAHELEKSSQRPPNSINAWLN